MPKAYRQLPCRVNRTLPLASLGRQGGNVEQSIKALTEQLNQAALKGGVATYDKLVADDYI